MTLSSSNHCNSLQTSILNEQAVHLLFQQFKTHKYKIAADILATVNFFLPYWDAGYLT